MPDSELKNMDEKRVILIIKPPGAYSEFSRLASENDWLLHAIRERGENDPSAFLKMYQTLDEKTTLFYIEDDLSDFPYIEIYGRDCEAIAETVCERIDVYTEQELFDIWDNAQNAEDAMDAILAIGLMGVATKSRERYLNVLKSGLRHPEADIRSAALTAFSYTVWEELKPFVVEIAEHDPDPDPMNRAKVLIDAWEAKGQ